jgi:DNA-binding MarR family transcriptional regulator
MSSSIAKSPGGPLLGALLRLASQFMGEKFSSWIESSGFKGVQPAHSAAIQPLWERPEGARITELARASRMTKQSMSALVSDLETAGYIERVKDPDDARAIRVRLTAHGRSYARAVRAFSRSVEADWAERIGSQRIEELCTTLELLRTRVFLARE